MTNIINKPQLAANSFAHPPPQIKSQPGMEALQLTETIELLAPAISQGRRYSARLISGKNRAFLTTKNCRISYVPYPLSGGIANTLRNVTCGLALQASPSKEALAALPLQELRRAELSALSIVEGEIALAWAIQHWPGLEEDLRSLLPDLIPRKVETIDGKALVQDALNLRKQHKGLIEVPELLGLLPFDDRARRTISSQLRGRSRMPYSIRKSENSKRLFTIPIGGSGGAKNTNLAPPPSGEDEPEIRVERRLGIPYDEWDCYRNCYKRDHVSVIERHAPLDAAPANTPPPEILRYFRLSPTRTWHRRLEDGTDLDVDAFVEQHCAKITGDETSGNVYRSLEKGERDVATAILLDGSSSLGTDGGIHLLLELACADALATALAQANERHGVFVFSGHSRHKVEVNVLKDFDEPHAVMPGKTGIQTAGYTRLGAPIRHITRRLLEVPADRRILLSIGDGLPSDEDYEGPYAWGDVAKSVEEAEQAGVLVYHIGVGRVRRDPLKDCFGEQRSQRIKSLHDLPRVLAQVHTGLCEL